MKLLQERRDKNATGRNCQGSWNHGNHLCIPVAIFPHFGAVDPVDEFRQKNSKETVSGRLSLLFRKAG